jgi:putative oxidoreductase
VQRFFSTFPNEWPGAGLLLLRLTLTGALFADAAAALNGTAAQVIAGGGEILTGALIAIGLWTPIAGVIVFLLQLSLILTADGAIGPHVLQAAVGLCLSLLGPGAWSIDARLFGRRRVEIKHLREEQR